MSHVLDSISPGFKALAAQLAAVGLNANELIKGDASALKSHIEAAAKAGQQDVPALIAEATQALNGQLQEKAQAFAAEQAKVALFTEAFSAAGIALKAADEAKGLQLSDLTEALAARASVKAQEQLAQHGLQNPVAVTPAIDPTKPAKSAKEMTRDEFFAQSPAQRLAFSKSGGRIID